MSTMKTCRLDEKKTEKHTKENNNNNKKQRQSYQIVEREKKYQIRTTIK